ncbi:MAG: FAD-binding oxidoreductase [Candidatus Tectomicrobia bacterium]|nr:FAD-binding oxidoreductase [Candidatus Tectomicrobia bacterium]
MTFSPLALYDRLTDLLGTANVCMDGPETAGYALGSRNPAVVAAPCTAEEVAEVLKVATREKLAVVPWGCGTQMHLGPPPSRYDVALSLKNLNRVLEYDNANLTLTVEAGLALCETYKLTTPERQFLPLGYPAGKASLGGLLATNTSGGKRLRYGGMRDLLLGIRVALPEGELLRYGGRVVKNVAGYDMCKLYIGSLGAFGVVTEATFRLSMLPEEERLLAGAFPSPAQAMAAATAVRQAALLPSAVVLASAAGWADAMPVTLRSGYAALMVQLEGSSESVRRQTAESEAIFTSHGAVDAAAVAGEELLTLWERLEGWRTSVPELGLVQVRIGVPPSSVEAALALLYEVPGFCRQPASWLADAGIGAVTARLPFDAQADDLAAQVWLHELRGRLHDLEGFAVVESAPESLATQLDVWGKPPGAELLKLYKSRFDPCSVLNPGRYVGGL